MTDSRSEAPPGVQSPAAKPNALPHLEETVLATTRYLATVRELTDEDLRAPSLLPGWSRGHVVTHVARNADALANLLHRGATGEERHMYPSQDARNHDIEQGAGRSAASLVADSEYAADRWESAARCLREERFDVGVARLPGWETFPVRRVGALRRTEVEVHHADLGAGYAAGDWPEDFVEHLLRRRERELAEDGVDLVLELTDLGRELSLGSGGDRVSGAAADVVWWLVGRGAGEGLTCSSGQLPELGKWA